MGGKNLGMPPAPMYVQGHPYVPTDAFDSKTYSRIKHLQAKLPDHLQIVRLREEKMPDILGTKYWIDFRHRDMPQELHVWAIDTQWPYDTLITKIQVFA
jgi:hypothetical protein